MVRTEPVTCPREQEAWEQVCATTSYETGQLRVEVETAEGAPVPVLHRRGREDFQLVTGQNIPTEESVQRHLPTNTIL